MKKMTRCALLCGLAGALTWLTLRATSALSSSGTEVLKGDEAVAHLQSLSDEAKANVRRQVHMQTESLQEEWDTLEMLGLQ